MSNIDNLTYKELKEIAGMFSNQIQRIDVPNKNHPFEIGKNYFIRTVTMIFIGKLEQVFDNELILSTAAWIPDTGRFMNCLQDGEKAINEIEPFQNDVIISRNSIIDATIWNHNLLVKQK
jgi:hypothetical protein